MMGLLPRAGEGGGIVAKEEGEVEHVAGDYPAQLVNQVLLLLHAGR